MWQRSIACLGAAAYDESLFMHHSEAIYADLNSNPILI